MSDYVFRGKPISGPAAYVLLGSIKRVLRDAPNPTLADITALLNIVEDFDKRVEADLIKETEELERGVCGCACHTNGTYGTCLDCNC